MVTLFACFFACFLESRIHALVQMRPLVFGFSDVLKYAGQVARHCAVAKLLEQTRAAVVEAVNVETQ